MILSQWRYKPRGAFRGFINIEVEFGLVIPDTRMVVGQHSPVTSHGNPGAGRR
jgi:hypothetical protein